MVDQKLEKLITDTLKDANVGNNQVIVRTDNLGQVFIEDTISLVPYYKLENILTCALKDANVGNNQVIVRTDNLGQVFIEEYDEIDDIDDK